MSRGRWLTPDVDGGDAVCRSLLIPPELMPFVGYLLDKLRIPDNWEQHGDMTIAETLDMVETMLANYPESCPEVNVLRPPIVLMWKTASKNSEQGAEVWTSVTTDEGGGVWSATTPQTGNSWLWAIRLAPGTYKFRLICNKHPAAGKIRFYNGSVAVGSAVDMYSATALRNVEIDSDNFDVTDTPEPYVSIQIEGKNASSSNYHLYFQYLHIMPISP